jgi:hypothetical protein
MKFTKQPTFTKVESEICPHLTLKDDKESYAAFPSTINACCRGNSPATPKFSHQRTFCLHSNYVNCPVNLAKVITKFPKELRLKSKKLFATKKSLLIPGIFFIFVTLVVLQLAFGKDWVNQANSDLSQTQEISPTATQEETDETMREASSDKTEIPSQPAPILLTESPGVAPTIRPDPILDLDTPIGAEQKFIIHRVLEGESLQYLADRYNTSPKAILDVNHNIISPLWVGWIIVIPVNTSDVDGLPSFSAQQIDDEGISLKTFASQFDISAEKLSIYNNIEVDHILHQGEWLIIPSN